MKKLKYILGFLLVFITFIKVNGDYEVDIIPNIQPGTYDKVLELTLETNSSKIFYYTNRIGNIYDLVEYTSPIIIKGDTHINFFSLKKDSYDTSFIKEVFYAINYSSQIDISYKNGVVYIKNNSPKTQDIGYWTVSGENLNYDIYKNTILSPGESFEILHDMLDQEEILLHSPDNKVVKSYKYVAPINTQKVKPEINKVENEVKTQSLTGIENTSSLFENTSNSGSENIKNLENISTNTGVSTYLLNKNTITKNTTSSIINAKTNNSLPLIFVFVSIILLLFVYNVITILQDKKIIIYKRKK